MSSQKFYSEEEAREIFALAGVQSSGSDLLTLQDLEKAASELGIDPEITREASKQINVLREEAADQREFKRRQFLPAISMIFVAVVMTALAMRPHAGGMLTLAGLEWLVAAQMLYRTITGNSTQYEMGFQRWRFKRIGRVAPEYLRPYVMATLEDYFRSYPTMDRRHLVCSWLMEKFGLSDEVSDRMLDEFLSAHPVYARQLERRENYLI